MALLQTRFESDSLSHLTVEDLYETILVHGHGVCYEGTTSLTEQYRVRKREVALDYTEMCRCLCELYRRNLLQTKHYELRQLLDLTPKCEVCRKTVTRDGYCGYTAYTYAQSNVRCANCAPPHYQSFNQDTYDAALAWTFHHMMDFTTTMMDEIKQELELLRLVKCTLEPIMGL